MHARTTSCLTVLAALLLPAAPAVGAPSPEPDAPYAKYDALLRTYVDAQGMVDYARFKQKDEQALRAVVRRFAAMSPRSMSPNERKAYWINAYNALTLKAMLEFYPLESIKDKVSNFGGYDVWDDYTMGPGKLSLNKIEHEILRKMGDPRIHSAIVCASKGCPPLRNEAYLPSKLDRQLDANCRFWLKDPRRGLQVRGDTAYVSKVFDWFGDDFAKGEQGRLRWIARYVEDPRLQRRLRSGSLDVETLDWDWALNAQ